MVEFPGFNKVTFMQDMTSAQCYHAEIGETKQLVDKRDNKKYWVTKLKDGNCWMTQNLDYDIPESEVPGIVRYDAATGLSPAGKVWPTFGVNADDGIPRYYDPGYYYKTDATDWTYDTSCHEQSEGFANIGCEEAGFTTTGDSHYSVGNFYNWYAATRGSGTKNTVGEARDSICPVGWRLPIGNKDVSGSFGTSIADGQKTTDKLSLAGVYKWTNNNDASTGAPSLRVAPLYFVPSGYIRSGALLLAGVDAYYWSSTVPSTAGYASRLYINYTTVNPAFNNYASYGISVRCLVLGS